MTTDQPGCSGGFDVYYYYRSSVNFGSINVLDFSSTSSSNYTVYGPYTNLSDACGSLTSPLVPTSSNGTSHTVSHSLVSDQIYVLKVHFAGCTTSLGLTLKSGFISKASNVWESTAECTGCIPGFRPKSGVYVVSAWTKDKEAQEVDSTTTYQKPSLVVVSGPRTRTLTASGDIIDGWQRIQDTVTVTNGDFDLTFACGSGGDCYFDDIRIFPTDGSMVTYVYDPLTFRLMAEMDDNNYAKFYEYDEDGKLIRVKKETERGIMTIQESRENNAKK
jgi:hypothetical protein